MEQKGSFIGFTFDGIHSSQLGIIHLYAGSGQLWFVTYYLYVQSREEYLEKYTEDFIPEWRETNSIFQTKKNTILENLQSFL